MPGNFGFSSVVLAAMTILAPSLAATLAIARPIPLDPPVTKITLSFNDPFFWKLNGTIYLSTQG